MFFAIFALLLFGISIAIYAYAYWGRSRLVHKTTGRIIPTTPMWLMASVHFFGEKAFNYYVSDMFPDVDMYGVYIMNLLFIEVASPDLAKQFLQDDVHFEKINSISTANLDRFLGTEQVVNSNGMTWKRHRSIIDRGFQDLKVYLKVFREKAKYTMDLVSGKRIDDWTDYTQKMALDILGGALFGHDFESLKDSKNVDLKSYNSLLDDLTSSLGTIYDILGDKIRFLPRNRRIEHDLDVFDSLFDRLVEKSNKKLLSNETESDFTMLDYMVDAMMSPDKDLSPKEVRDNFGVFFLAGHETTANALGFAVYCLAFHEDIQDKIREEVKSKIGNSEVTMENLKELD
jgi:cytochrome P450